MAIGFRLVADPDVTEYKVVRVASQAYTIGDAVMSDRTSNAVDVVPATSSSTTANIYGVAMQTVASSATELLVALITNRQRWTADATNTTNTDHNFLRYALTNKAAVNNTTDGAAKESLFEQIGLGDTSTRVVGRFLTSALSA